MKIKKISKTKLSLTSNSNKETLWTIKKNKVIKLENSEILKDLPQSALAQRQVYKVYGNRPPYPLTLTKGVFRLLPNLPLIINLKTKNVTNSLQRPLQSINEKWKLEDYYKAFEAAVVSNRPNKIIFMSSGWDSSSIMASLVKKYGPSKISAIILRLEYGYKNPVNRFEIDKAKKLCKFFKVRLRIAPSIYFNKKLLLHAIHALKKNHLYNFTAINHWTLWQAVKRLGYLPRQTVVYAGECSDGAHNFGFSQNFSAVYPEKGYRQYADKVRSYFISPSFLQRIQDENNIGNDELVKRFMPGKILKKEKSIKNLCKKMLVGMFFNDDRGPYSSTKSTPRDQLLMRQYLRLMRNLLPEKPEHLYASILEFYKRHHWQGSTVMGLRSLMPNGYELKLPFGNEKMLELLATMPTRFGRGLEPEPTKYPLKMYCKTQVRYPLEVQDGAHSYLYDTNQAISLYKIIYIKSPFGSMIRKSLWKYNDIKIRNKTAIKNPHEATPKQIEKIIAAFFCEIKK